MFWLNLLYWAVATVLSEIIRPKPRFENARPSALGDFNFPSATEGRAVPIIWGRVRSSGPNLVWYGNYRAVARTERVKTGVFSSEDIIIGYRYYVGMQFAICRGTVDHLHGVKINDKSLVVSSSIDLAIAFSRPLLFGGEDHGQGGMQGVLHFYKGSPTQSINSYLSGFQSPTPAYRGICYAAYNGWVGNTTAIPPWTFEVSRIPDGLSMATTDPGAEAPNTWDANPINVLYEILTDTDWGLSISPSEVDVPNFRAAASVLAAEGNGFSMILDSELQITDLIDEIQRQIDGSLYFNRATGQWQVALARADYDPGDLDVYDESVISELSEFTRQTWEETSNQVRVAYTDRTDNYKSSYGLAQDSANISIQGFSVNSDLNFPGVKNRDLANAIAWRELRALAYPLSKVSFTINRNAFNRVPGSLFKLSWTRLGITEIVYRVGSISYGKPGSSEIVVFAVQDIFATEVGTFSPPQGTGWTVPEDGAVAVTTSNALALEAPRQMVVQDTYAPTQEPRIWMGARWPGGGTVALRAYLRAGASRPISEAYAEDAGISQFILSGTLDSALADYSGSATRPATYNIDITEEDDLSPLAVDGDVTGVQSLTTIAYIDGEYIGYEALTDLTGGSWRLSRIYRGLFHTAPKEHDAGTRVWFLRGNLTTRLLLATYDEVDVQLRSQDLTGTDVTPTALEVTLSRLWQAPLAPRDPKLHGAYAPTSASVDTTYPTETGRSGNDARALKVEITPRDWLVDDPTADTTLTADWASYSPEFDYSLELTNTVGPVTVAGSGAAYILRNDIIVALGANEPFPSGGTLVVTARHTVGGSPVTNPVSMTFPVGLTSNLIIGTLVHGGVPTSGSTGVIYPTNGSYSFNIRSALPSSGELQGRLNGGGWTTIVAGGASSGSLAALANDVVELRTTVAPAADQYFYLNGPSSEVGYGVLVA